MIYIWMTHEDFNGRWRRKTRIYHAGIYVVLKSIIHGRYIWLAMAAIKCHLYRGSTTLDELLKRVSWDCKSANIGTMVTDLRIILLERGWCLGIGDAVPSSNFKRAKTHDQVSLSVMKIGRTEHPCRHVCKFSETTNFSPLQWTFTWNSIWNWNPNFETFCSTKFSPVESL